MVGERKMATVGRKQTKRKQLQEDCNQKVFDFHQEDDKKALSGSEDEAIGDETVIVDKVAKKRAAAELDEEEAACAIGTNEVYSMLEKFGADISKGMQAKKKRLELLTKNYMKGSQHKLEQLWSSSHSHRKKMTQQYSQKVNSALQQWESEAQRAVDQEEKLNSLFRQQQKILQQARVARDQKLKLVRELYEQFIKDMEDMEKGQEAFLQGAQQELKKEMSTLQKKILMDMQQEMATVRKSLHSMLF
ncbi:synaptonemal complex protein 3 isoform X4 [Gouania willdenowi]|uniref:synaptonemal complex protein 3 isoform X4 n=1 Tax=Gouania willdenowi TaxID=441366 RepID=UPI001056B700|nr:synaptonemal complex protein 3 isoform X4 [Gouania willdenowi]